ncbi:transposase-like protein, partial [Bradyrhizobium liaoningense]
MSDQARSTVGQRQIGRAGQKRANLDLDRPGKQVPRAGSNDIGQWIINRGRLTESKNIGSLGHGVSLSSRGSGRLVTRLDTPPSSHRHHPDSAITSAILPLWARRTKSLDALLPVLYLRGISTGDFQEALAALLGKDAPNLSPAVVSRLTTEWQLEYERWQKRDLSARRYVYVWADGVFLQARMEDHSECMLVLIGATPEGKKELIGFQVGVRESTQSWHELLVEAKTRGLKIAPEIAVGDGALGFWKALDEVFPATRHQRCWVHKTANILNKVAVSVQASMKKDLREVYLASNRASAEVAIDVFAEKYGAKYDKAVECLTKDRD